MKKFVFNANEWNVGNLDKVFEGVNALFNIKVVKDEWQKVYRLQSDVNPKGRGSLVAKCVTLGEFKENQKSELMEKLNTLLSYATNSKNFSSNKAVKSQNVSYWYNTNL